MTEYENTLYEKYNRLTVLELRKAAKELGVKLGAGISKQGIVEKIVAALRDQPQQGGEPAPAAESHPIRKAAIIADDESEEEERPAFTAPPLRPVLARPAPTGAPSSLSTISAKAPAFTMEGSRAWHNPRPYTNNSAPRPAQNTWKPRPAAPQETGVVYQRPAARPAQPQSRPSYSAQRFGPEQTETPDTRPPYAAGGQDYQPVRDYSYSAQAGGGYAGAPRDYDAQSASPVYARREMREGAQMANTPNMNDLMMAGECGDGEGILEIQPEGYGVLRAAGMPGKNDIYVSAAQIRRFSLRAGDHVAGKTRPQRETDRYCALLYITEVNGQTAEEAMNRVSFDALTAIYPKEKIRLAAADENDLCLRAMDILCPIGLGQRALITSPARGGKTTLIGKLCAAVQKSAPQAETLVLLLDERPEDVTAMRESVQAEVIAAPADQTAELLMRTAEMTLERAERLVEQKKHVILFVDGLTKYAKACSQAAPAAARTLPSGLAAGAMAKPKRFFGAARNTREAGSLTIIATQQAPTDPMEEAIAEEYRNLCNMEMTLVRLPQEKRLFPAFDPRKCKTRRGEMLLSREETELARRMEEAAEDKTLKEALDAIIRLMEAARE